MCIRDRFKDATGYEEFLEFDPAEVKAALDDPDKSHADEMLSAAEKMCIRDSHEGVFTIDEVQEELQMLFAKQYILTQTVEVEVRYRTETRTDSEGNDYDVEVPYNYYICNVKLENFDLSHVPIYIMDEETLYLYAVYMAVSYTHLDVYKRQA